jgi:hypothetical protein
MFYLLSYASLPLTIIMGKTGLQIFQAAELAYHQGNIQQAFETYQLAIKKIAKDEIVSATIPSSMIASLPDTMPSETLLMVWRNFVGFFRDNALNFTQGEHGVHQILPLICPYLFFAFDTSPAGYKLLASYRPGTGSKEHPRFRGDRAQLILKAMQIEAGLTMGLLAWDKKERATAAKRYKEALDLAATHNPFDNIALASRGMEQWIATDVQDTKDNLRILMMNDITNAQILQSHGIEGGALRRENIAIPNARVEGDIFSPQHSIQMATDGCASCGKREVKLQRCSKCKKVACTLPALAVFN